MIVYLSTADIAKRLGITHAGVSKLRTRGKLPPPDAQIADRYGWVEKTIALWEAGRR